MRVHCVRRQAALAAFVLLAAACGSPGSAATHTHAGDNAAPPAPSEPEAPAPVVVRGGMEVSDQVGDGTSITVGKVTIEGLGGWVVIHEDQGGPERILGHAHVDEGVTRNLVLPLDAPVPPGGYWVMLHRDGGASGVFEWPGGPDGPVRAPVGVAYVLKKVQLSSAPASS